VALCSWNGEQFIDEQLESLARQIRLPDELIICDDASSDSTIGKLQRFAAGASFIVTIHRNRERLGVARNLEQAISLCTGELILLADQDDVWQPEKIARIVRAFEQDPEIDCIFTDAELINQVGTPMRKGLWRTIGFDRAERGMVRMGRALDVLSVHTQMRTIEDRVNHLRVRAGLPASRILRIGVIVRELWNRHYHRFSNGYVSLLKDLLRRI
jgi:glycosyltransferase involved in cell wall biosynthesis